MVMLLQLTLFLNVSLLSGSVFTFSRYLISMLQCRYGKIFLSAFRVLDVRWAEVFGPKYLAPSFFIWRTIVMRGKSSFVVTFM